MGLTDGVTAGSSPAVLRANALGKSFGHFRALEGVHLELFAGQCLLLLGSNGAGKTTLLRILAGLTPATAGSFTLLGIEARRLPAQARRQTGFLSHLPQLYAELSARENLLFFAELYGVPQPKERVSWALALVDMEAQAERAVGAYSRGMQQRISIAKALLHDPPLLLLDEPYSGLDASAARKLNALLERFHGQGKSMILTTHQLEMALPFSDRAAILHRGRLAFNAGLAGRMSGGTLPPTELASVLEKYL